MLLARRRLLSAARVSESRSRGEISALRNVGEVRRLLQTGTPGRLWQCRGRRRVPGSAVRQLAVICAARSSIILAGSSGRRVKFLRRNGLASNLKRSRRRMCRLKSRRSR